MVTKLKKEYIESKPNQLLIIMKMYPNREWSYFDLLQNPNMTEKMLLNHPEIFTKKYTSKYEPFFWYVMNNEYFRSIDPNLTYKTVNSLCEFDWLSNNRFLYDKLVFKQEYENDTMKKTKIIFYLLKNKISNDTVSIIKKYISAI
jgi:hypothetical protein